MSWVSAKLFSFSITIIIFISCQCDLWFKARRRWNLMKGLQTEWLICVTRNTSLYQRKGSPRRTRSGLYCPVFAWHVRISALIFFHLKMQMLHYILFIIAIKLWPICMILSHLARKELYTVAWCNVSCYTIYGFTRTIVPFTLTEYIILMYMAYQCTYGNFFYHIM